MKILHTLLRVYTHTHARHACTRRGEPISIRGAIQRPLVIKLFRLPGLETLGNVYARVTVIYGNPLRGNLSNISELMSWK